MARAMLLSDAEQAVDAYLDSIVSCNSGLLLARKDRIVFRADLNSLAEESKVALVSGGGSGHEPSHAGFVGKGMLSAAVAGSVFASPPVKSILTALRTISGPASIVLIVKNYTGDRLNFGLAVEEYRAERPDIRVEMVLVKDDIATKHGPVGARGVCGTIFYHKILGAMAEAGCSIDALLHAAKKLDKVVATSSASLGRCNVPGHTKESFSLDEYEIGVGIHNEPGTERRPLEALAKIVQTVMDPLVAEVSTGEPGNLVVLVNNLGGLSALEVGNISTEVIRWFKGKGHQLTAIATGSFLTSLDMPGFSVTVANLNEEQLRFLRAPTTCSAWPTMNPLEPNHNFGAAERSAKSLVEEARNPADVSPELVQFIQKAIQGAATAVIENELLLNELDAVSGDGDCGSTLAGFARLILDADAELMYSDPAELFRQLSKIAQTTGGTSGALYGILLGTLSRELKDPTTVRGWILAVDKSVDRLAFYSGAKPGQKTMLDVLDPLRNYLLELPTNISWKEFKEDAGRLVLLCDSAAEATASTKAQAGRASYCSAREDIAGSPDAGSMAVAIWVKEIVDSILDACTK